MTWRPIAPPDSASTGTREYLFQMQDIRGVKFREGVQTENAASGRHLEHRPEAFGAPVPCVAAARDQGRVAAGCEGPVEPRSAVRRGDRLARALRPVRRADPAMPAHPSRFADR